MENTFYNYLFIPNSNIKYFLAQYVEKLLDGKSSTLDTTDVVSDGEVEDERKHIY